MKRTIIAMLCLVIGVETFARQGIDTVLLEIDKNNTTLRALRENIEAMKIGNKTDIYLPNPEFEYGYLWGSPKTIGHRIGVNFKQSFDFPTAYYHKSQISGMKNGQLGLEYERQRKTLLLEARQLCADLVYSNAMKSELRKRLAHAQSIANSYQAKYKAGEANVLEMNKSQLNLLNIGKRLGATTIESNALLANLSRMNGDIPIEFADSVFNSLDIPADFSQWYLQAEQNNPELGWLEHEIEISREQEMLDRSLSLPKPQIGYLSEKVTGQQYQGITIGLSVPLFENKNKVKFAKANTLALKSAEADGRLQYRAHLKSLYEKVAALQKNVVDYRLALTACDNADLLKKALDKGEISLTDYLLELSVYYESVDKLLELERELNRDYAELNQYM